MQDLTANDIKTLNFIVQYQEENGYSPSLEDIKNAISTKSTRGAVLHLEKLKKFGYLERKNNSRRAIKILIKPDDLETILTRVPIVGEVKAGYGGIAEQMIDDYRDIPISLTGGRRDVFLLRVKGDSMTKADINPGDLLIVSPETNVKDGDIVIAFDPDNEEATVKRFKRMKEYMVLLPESHNPNYEPKIGSGFIIQGKVLNKFEE